MLSCNRSRDIGIDMPKPLLPNRRLVVGLVGATILGGAGMAMAWPWRRGLPDPTDARTTLQAVEDAIARLLPEPEITTAALAARMAAGEPIILFDTREPDEYAQSHLPGALRVPPDASASTILAQYRALMADATVVVYCSVGWRSGLVVQAIRRAAHEAPAKAIFNLRGGIFRWHAEGRPLEFGPGASGVHPFSRDWGQLLKRLG
jgi:rhodanese-related sulfurtransferase